MITCHVSHISEDTAPSEVNPPPQPSRLQSYKRKVVAPSNGPIGQVVRHPVLFDWPVQIQQSLSDQNGDHRPNHGLAERLDPRKRMSARQPEVRGATGSDSLVSGTMFPSCCGSTIRGQGRRP